MPKGLVDAKWMKLVLTACRSQGKRHETVERA